MKKTIFLTILIAGCMVFSANIKAQSMKGTDEARKNLEPYSVTIDSLQRHVIYLDQKPDEDLFKVEIIAGKTMQVDCNNYRLMGQFKEEDVEGWGYPYYLFNTGGEVLSTMMACPDVKQEKFVSAESALIRYNSRLPIVVYAPQDIEIKYRIWTAGTETKADLQ